MNFPHFYQIGNKSCGPTCLKILLSYYSRDSNVDVIDSVIGLNDKEATMSDLCKVAKLLSFETVAVRSTVEGLKKCFNAPCILHWNDSHFVVLYKIGRNFYISDPSIGKIKLSKGAFIKFWCRSDDMGYALLLEPK